MKKIARCKINEILLFLFLFVSIFFPFDLFSLKKITFLLLIILNLRCLIKHIFLKKNIFITFYSIILPTFIIFISTITTSNFKNSFSRGFSMYLLIIVFIINEYKINYKKMCTVILWALVYFILFLAVSDFMGIFDINTSVITKFIYKYDMGFVGKSVEYSFYYKIFLRTSPLIIILVFEYLDMKKFHYVLIVYISLIFTGTRANVGLVALGAIIFIIYRLLNCRGKVKKLNISIIIVFMLILLICFVCNIEYLMNIFIEKSSGSDMIRKGHLNGFIDLIKFNSDVFWLGSGLGSSFLSYSVGMTSSIELSYIDLLRQIGFPVFLVYMIFLLYPIINVKRFKYKSFLLLTYSIIAATNPLLISSTGYIMYIFIYYYDCGGEKYVN